MSARDQVFLAECEQCRALFERAEAERWKRLCLDCWRRSKATEKAPPADRFSEGWEAGWRVGFKDGRMDWDSAQVVSYEAGFQAGHATALADAARATPAAGMIDKARIRQILQLVHPDKHAGSALAGEVTAWLLSLRKGVER